MRITQPQSKGKAWGARVIDRLSEDLKDAFPDMTGLSGSNLLSVKLFAEAFPDGKRPNRPRLLHPRGICPGRGILEIQCQLHKRQGMAITNFPQALPPLESDMAAQVFPLPNSVSPTYLTQASGRW